MATPSQLEDEFYASCIFRGKGYTPMESSFFGEFLPETSTFIHGLELSWPPMATWMLGSRNLHSVLCCTPEKQVRFQKKEDLKNCDHRQESDELHECFLHPTQWIKTKNPKVEKSFSHRFISKLFAAGLMLWLCLLFSYILIISEFKAVCKARFAIKTFWQQPQPGCTYL